VSGRAGSARAARSRPSGRHFLRSGRLAAELVYAAGVAADDLVLDVGAGRGIITAELARWAAAVRAIELDAALAAALRERFSGEAHVEVIEGDALAAPLPRRTFRVVANIPFAATGALLERLLADPDVPLSRADVIVEAGAARKRARSSPSTLRSVLWAPWYELSVARELPASAFDPPPSVDAAVLVARRRARPLLPASDRAAFAAFVRRGFDRSGRPLRADLAGVLTPRQLKRAASALRFARDARARDLEPFQWIELYRLARALGATR
jgi:23S rRNA (adenine-N6)-dimethyltransferase